MRIGDWVLQQLEERGELDAVERKATYLACAAFRSVAPITWTGLYFHAYADGACRGLTGNRLDQYAHAYADVSEKMARRFPVECFWLGWQAGQYEANAEGTWRVRTPDWVKDWDEDKYLRNWEAVA